MPSPAEGGRQRCKRSKGVGLHFVKDWVRFAGHIPADVGVLNLDELDGISLPEVVLQLSDDFHRFLAHDGIGASMLQEDSKLQARCSAAESSATTASSRPRAASNVGVNLAESHLTEGTTARRSPCSQGTAE